MKNRFRNISYFLDLDYFEKIKISLIIIIYGNLDLPADVVSTYKMACRNTMFLSGGLFPDASVSYKKLTQNQI